MEHKFNTGDTIRVSQRAASSWWLRRIAGKVGVVTEVKTWFKDRGKTHYRIHFKGYKIPHYYDIKEIDTFALPTTQDNENNE